MSKILFNRIAALATCAVMVARIYSFQIGSGWSFIGDILLLIFMGIFAYFAWFDNKHFAPAIIVAFFFGLKLVTIPFMGS